MQILVWPATIANILSHTDTQTSHMYTRSMFLHTYWDSKRMPLVSYQYHCSRHELAPSLNYASLDHCFSQKLCSNSIACCSMNWFPVFKSILEQCESVGLTGLSNLWSNEICSWALESPCYRHQGHHPWHSSLSQGWSVTWGCSRSFLDWFSLETPF